MCPHFAAAEKWLDKELHKLGHAVEEATADSQVHCLTFAKLTLTHLGGLKCKKQGKNRQSSCPKDVFIEAVLCYNSYSVIRALKHRR